MIWKLSRFSCATEHPVCHNPAFLPPSVFVQRPCGYLKAHVLISHLFKASLNPSINSPSKILPSSSPKMRPVHNKLATFRSSNCKSIPLIRRPCNMIDIFNSFEQLKSNTMQRPNPPSPRHLEHPKPERLTVNEPRRHGLNHLLRAHRMGGMIEEPNCNDDNICGAKNGADEVAARDAVGHDSASRRSSWS